MNFNRTDDRATNPVIGIVLLIGVAVILSASIGTFLIGLSSNLGGGAQAAVEMSNVVKDSEDGFVTISAVSMQRANRISVEAAVIDGNDHLEGESGATAVISENLRSSGESVTFRQASGYNGDVELEIVAVAHYQDESARIYRQEYTI